MNSPLIGKCEQNEAKTIPISGCKTDRCLQEINKLAEEYTVENVVIRIGMNDLKDDPHDVTLKMIKLRFFFYAFLSRDDDNPRRVN